MEVVTGVFQSRADAETAVSELRNLGIPDKQIGLLAPGDHSGEVEAGVPVTDTEEPGMGRAMGAAVGGAMGAAGGTTLGLAVATLVVPGIGPVLAFGMIGAALLGVVGAAAGSAVGDAVEEELGEGVPHEDLFIYEDVLRQGRSIVIAYPKDEDEAERAADVLKDAGAEDMETVRENWWRKLRDEERNYYGKAGRDFDRDELNYRRGFQAALHPRRRGKAYANVEEDLRTAYSGVELDTAFREGYERGLGYQGKFGETRRG
jgi:hypothetical protein